MLSPGTLITPSLRLLRPLGRGGMGMVWVAQHLTLSTQVVVKFVAPELVNDEAALARFRNEAAAASQVRSPHVVQMLDHGITSDGEPFIAMELLEGQDLAARLRAQGRLPPRQMATIVSQVARALSRAHEQGVVHRDIKPENIFLTDFGAGEAFVKVLDFGVARSRATAPAAMTKTGAMMGTPHYMSPEQVLGSRDLDFTTDLWALAVLTFEALTGQKPFDGATVGALAVAICHGPLPRASLAAPHLGAHFDAWFERACARQPNARFRNALEMAVALERAVGGVEPVPLAADDDALTLVLNDGSGMLPSGRTEMMVGLPRLEPELTQVMPQPGATTTRSTVVTLPTATRTRLHPLVFLGATASLAAVLGLVAAKATSPAKRAGANPTTVITAPLAREQPDKVVAPMPRPTADEKPLPAVVATNVASSPSAVTTASTKPTTKPAPSASVIAQPAGAMPSSALPPAPTTAVSSPWGEGDEWPAPKPPAATKPPAAVPDPGF